MSTSKLGRDITSPAFFDHANAAIAEAVPVLEAKGIKPAYIMRDSTREKTQGVSAEVRGGRRLASLSSRLAELSRAPAGANQLDNATAAVARALSLAKTAMPGTKTKFLTEIRAQLHRSVRCPHWLSGRGS
ncbi:hypothetical protein [Paraburkholderia graminis]|uniref:hypothetical protein n=1 Tax=Paraburkholderia graminis TaxID=60548 RepID=UPI002791A1FF|nr:hypothetical protein [Paraburkholderia graminis]MDQ0621613.1 hypothetical protein [Paraburkholderia graminis]